MPKNTVPEVRFKLVALLIQGPKTMKELTEQMPEHFRANHYVSKTVSNMKQTGFINSKQGDNGTVYYLSAEGKRYAKDISEAEVIPFEDRVIRTKKERLNPNISKKAEDFVSQLSDVLTENERYRNAFLQIMSIINNCLKEENEQS